MAEHFYSNGKLLVTGEYLVLHGAYALSIPVRFGQSLEVQESEEGVLEWKTKVMNKSWFDCSIDLSNFQILRSTNPIVAGFLQFILRETKKFNPEFLKSQNGLKLKSTINFNINWGLGSSSSLIVNIARWAQIDPFALFFRVSNGSGYDIASAQTDNAIIYNMENGKPNWKEVNFQPPFAEHLFFVYRGRKTTSEKEVSRFKSHYKVDRNEVNKISALTHQIVKAQTLEDFEQLLLEHENLIAKIIGRQPVKNELFPEHDGMVKSLGAWGGDFVLLSCRKDEQELKEYLHSKGFETCFSFKEIIKTLDDES